MTPSKEALSAADAIHAQGFTCLGLEPTIATLIDTAYAEHRERVRRLVEATQRLAILAFRLDDENVDNAFSPTPAEIVEARAALAPFLEQETVT